MTTGATNDWVTPDRVMALVKLRKAGRQWCTILAQLAALHGTTPVERDVKRYCKRHNVPGRDQAAKTALAAMRAAKAVKAANAPTVLFVDLDPLGTPPTLATCIREDGPDFIACGVDEVSVWATDNGIRFRGWDDLPAVNLRREMMGLLRVARCFGRR